MKRRLYETTQWRKLRECAIAHDRFTCRACGTPVVPGHPELSPVVDHIRPWRGNEDLFWDESNLQCLHKKCHDAKTAQENRERMVTTRVGIDGWATRG